jgi:hypothetical protein
MAPLHIQLARSTLRGVIKRLHFPLEVMLVCVRWYAAYPQDGALVGKALLPGELRELAKQRHVVQRFFHRRVAQREPLLHEVDAQHRLQRKRRAARLALGRVRLDQSLKLGPRHHALHLRQELALARSLRAQVQTQVGLLHGSARHASIRSAQAELLGGYADLP